MPYYIAPYIGRGTTFDPFRPLGSDQSGWSAIDLRPDGGATLVGGGLNACLLYLPISDPDPRLRLIGLDPADTLGAAQINAIEAKLGIILNPGTLLSIVRQIMLDPPVTGWKPVGEGSRNAIEINLGPLRSVQLARLAGGSLQSETWPSNSTTISSGQDKPWNEDNGDVEVASGKLQPITSNSVSWGRCTRAVLTDNHRVTADYGIISTNDFGFAGVMCRKTDDALRTCYEVWGYRDSGGGISTVLMKEIDNASTALASDATDPGASGTVMVQADGSSISGRIGGNTFSPVTDSAITGNKLGGYVLNYGGAVRSDATLDNIVVVDLLAIKDLIDARGVFPKLR